MSPISPLYRAREIARLTCLRHFAGRQSIKSAVFDATTLTLTNLTNPLQYTNIYGSNLTTVQVFNVPIGSFVGESPNDTTKIAVYTGWGSNVNDVQTIAITGSPTGGTFTLTFNGLTTANIAYNATAAQVATAVGALANVGTGNIAGSSGPLPGSSVILTFGGLLASMPQNLMTASGAGLVGGSSPNVTVTHTATGSFAQHILGVFDGPDRDFFSNVVAADEAVPVYYHSCVFDVSKLQNWLLYGSIAKTALPTCDFF
jgi:hypothetical protein